MVKGLAVLIFVLVGSLDCRSAEKIYTRAGELKRDIKGIEDKEPFDWQLSSEERKGLKKIENNPYMRLAYDETCFDVGPQGSGEDISESIGLVFRKKPKCQDKHDVADNWLGLMQTYNSTEIHKSFSEYRPITKFYKRVGRINGNPAMLVLNAEDVYDSQGKGVVAGWSLFLHCKDVHFIISTAYKMGKPSIDYILQKKYTFPEEYKRILSTFECTNKDKEIYKKLKL